MMSIATPWSLPMTPIAAITLAVGSAEAQYIESATWDSSYGQFGAGPAVQPEPRADQRGQPLPVLQPVLIRGHQPLFIGRAAAPGRGELPRPPPERAGPVDERVVQVDEKQRHAGYRSSSRDPGTSRRVIQESSSIASTSSSAASLTSTSRWVRSRGR